MISSGSVAVILRQSSEKDGQEAQWEIPQNIQELRDGLLNSRSEPLLKNLTEDRIEKLNEDGTIGAIQLTAAEVQKIESYMHRHWQNALSIGHAPDIQSFQLDDFLDFGKKKLKDPNQMDILVHLRAAFKARKDTRELELILCNFS
ncbi:MAG: hypothetical protein DI586_09785 [Micavibrio aeruginosavorus]|uniref:Uncharacterized protein n=1 Tax=Micavibrio aeruginosavorus TaxID=349221 RepID=A0A2W5H8U9_9BACT|nr:MAG: hypothetical protein DI586_09785 [Micavibrio aeruginosavorus]